LGTEETDLLLYEMPGFYGVQGLDVLLTALVEAVSGWTGGRWVPIVVPHSGRSTIPGVGTLDLSRTMGCLIQHRLVMLGREETDDPEVALRSIHEQFRRIPNWGLGYRMLLYYSREARVVEQLAALLPYAAKIEFNYISAQRDGRSRRDRTVFRPAREFIGIVGDVQNPVTNLLACNACVVNGQLSLEWWYSASVHEHTTIEKVCTDFEEALRALIARYRSRAMHSPPRS
jgi:microcystin synthetase protein McyA